MEKRIFNPSPSNKIEDLESTAFGYTNTFLTTAPDHEKDNSKEQQLPDHTPYGILQQQPFYYNPQANYQTINALQSYQCQQQLFNGQLINYFATSNCPAQHQQQQTFAAIDMPTLTIQPSMLHSITNQQPAVNI